MIDMEDELDLLPFCSKEVNEYEQKIKESEIENPYLETGKGDGAEKGKGKL